MNFCQYCIITIMNFYEFMEHIRDHLNQDNQIPDEKLRMNL